MIIHKPPTKQWEQQQCSMNQQRQNHRLRKESCSCFFFRCCKFKNHFNNLVPCLWWIYKFTFIWRLPKSITFQQERLMRLSFSLHFYIFQYILLYNLLCINMLCNLLFTWRSFQHSGLRVGVCQYNCTAIHMYHCVFCTIVELSVVLMQHIMTLSYCVFSSAMIMIMCFVGN